MNRLPIPSEVQVPQRFGWPFGSAGALSLAFAAGVFIAAPSNYHIKDEDKLMSALFAVAGLRRPSGSSGAAGTLSFSLPSLGASASIATAPYRT